MSLLAEQKCEQVTVGPRLAGVRLADLHPLDTLSLADAHDDSATIMRLIALSSPADTLSVIKVVVRLAIGEVPPCSRKVGKLVDRLRGFLALVIKDTPKVATEDARVAFMAQEDQGVGERLKDG